MVGHSTLVYCVCALLALQATWKSAMQLCSCIAYHSKTFFLLQSNEFKYNKPQFLEKAKEWTQKYATSNKVTAASVKVLLKMFEHC